MRAPFVGQLELRHIYMQIATPGRRPTKVRMASHIGGFGPYRYGVRARSGPRVSYKQQATKIAARRSSLSVRIRAFRHVRSAPSAVNKNAFIPRKHPPLLKCQPTLQGRRGGALTPERGNGT